jgi:murein DD-endopeptidase MepM/ murein hydrolase activator NlpD
MMESMRWLAGLVVLLLAGLGTLYIVAGRGAPPVLTINKPDRFVGQRASVDVTAEAPNARFSKLKIALEQNGKTLELFSLDPARDVATATVVTHVDRNRLRISLPFGKQSVPELQQGVARIVVTATRPALLNLRTLSATATKDVQIRLEPPRIAVLSTKHYVNHGGAEMVVYRVTPSDVMSGVRVGMIEYAGFPASGAGVSGNRETSTPEALHDQSVKVAFFALLHDQDLTTPIVTFARDEAGNEATARFVDNVFEKPFKRSRIELNDAFMGRVVPEIIEHAPELRMTPPTGDPLPAFLRINGELRRINAEEIAAFAKKTSPMKLWQGPFVQLSNSQVEASFADHRTYFYHGQEVDQQVHLGFDLASTARVPVVAANSGTIVNAKWLGIYGNCAIIDHGMGVQSLYAHLSSFDVKVGDAVVPGQTIGRTGMTGLAGGDHLHFTMLIGGQMVNPMEWWDSHWIADRIDRKLGEAR